MAGKYPNSGILGRNQNRRNDKDPEYSGTAEVDGVEYWLSAWINEGDKGKYFKLSFKPKQPRGQPGGGWESRDRRSHDDRGEERPF